METELVKEAFSSAEKELKEKQVSEVKKIVLKTLEKMDKLTKERDKLSDDIKILRMDIDDLKEGKIDRIVERQEKDAKAREASVVIIIKEKEVVREVSPWYWPYRIVWQNGYVPTAFKSTTVPAWTFPDYAITSVGTKVGNLLANTSTDTAYINCSVAKDATSGSYEVGNKVVHLR